MNHHQNPSTLSPHSDVQSQFHAKQRSFLMKKSKLAVVFSLALLACGNSPTGSTHEGENGVSVNEVSGGAVAVVSSSSRETKTCLIAGEEVDCTDKWEEMMRSSSSSEERPPIDRTSSSSEMRPPRDRSSSSELSSSSSEPVYSSADTEEEYEEEKEQGIPAGYEKVVDLDLYDCMGSYSLDCFNHPLPIAGALYSKLGKCKLNNEIDTLYYDSRPYGAILEAYTTGPGGTLYPGEKMRGVAYADPVIALEYLKEDMNCRD